MNIDTILALLKEGHSVDDIASEFTANLNKAMKEYEEAEAKRKADEQHRKDAEALICALENYVKNYKPGFNIEASVPVDEMMTAIDAVIDEFYTLTSKVQEIKNPVPKKSKHNVKVMTPEEADKVLNDFLKSLWAK